MTAMWTRLRHWWDVITTGYWFVPMLMSMAAVALATLLLYADAHQVIPDEHSGWLYTGGADGAKTLLSTIAGSVITVAGVAYSITIAALSQASSQFGPRLLRNFMRDTGNQVVLGTFSGTFLYCLLILRAIRGEFEGGEIFVPHASVTVAVLLATASIAMLIYFIHHISVSLQAPSVVAAVAEDLHSAIGDLPRREVEHKGPPAIAEEISDQECCTVASDSDGYVQAVNREALLHLAKSSDCLVHVLQRPGDHVICHSPVAKVWPKERDTEELRSAINRALIVGRRRTPEQDIGFAFRQLVELAVRALSPGINDPFTAINCVDALGSALCHAARHDTSRDRWTDEHGTLRLLLPPTTFEDLVDASFNQIRQYGRSSVAVTIRLLEVLTECARQIPREVQKQSLTRQAKLIYDEALQSLRAEDDLADVTRRWNAFQDAALVSPSASNDH